MTAEGAIAANKGSGPLAAMSEHRDYQGPIAAAHGVTLTSDTSGAPLGSSFHDHAAGMTVEVQRAGYAEAADRGHALQQMGQRCPSGDPSALGPERVAPTGVGARFRQNAPQAAAQRRRDVPARHDRRCVLMLTMDDALDSLGAKFCGQCAAKLPVAGDQCPTCGALPAVTRNELAEALAEPGALAKAEADELRAEAERLRDEMMAKLREADRVEHVSSLRNARDRAQDALEDAHERQRQADSALREAQKAEEAAAAPMREAYDLHRKAEQDEEAARRLGKGPAAEMEALGRLNAAATVLARYQAPLHEATAAKETAQALADDAVMGVQAAEEARDAAVWGYEHPGYIPLSGETVNIPAQPLTRFSLGLDLDNKTELSPVDRMLAALPGWSMAVLAGLVKDAENKARIAERKAIEEEEAKRPRVSRDHGPRAGRRAVPGGVYSPGARP